jgi:hypothetical protein
MKKDRQQQKPRHHHWPGQPSNMDALKKILKDRIEWEQSQPHPNYLDPGNTESKLRPNRDQGTHT